MLPPRTAKQSKSWSCSWAGAIAAVFGYVIGAFKWVYCHLEWHECVCVCVCLFSEIDVARQCIVAGAHSDQFCQPFDSQERGTERAIDYICGNGKHGIYVCVPSTNTGACKAPFTRYNLLSNRLYNRLYSCKRGIMVSTPRGNLWRIINR